MNKLALILFLIPAISACATVPRPLPSGSSQTGSTRPLPSNPLKNIRGLEAVMGKSASQLIRQFGKPRLDIHESKIRKLQFSNGSCVLDAYLYPDKRGKGPFVTHIDARRSDGAAVDRASCIKVLKKR